MSIVNVALIGGTGTIGAPLLQHLQASPFHITVLNRQSSTSVYPGAKVVCVPDDLAVDAVAQVLSENDIHALIIAFAGHHVACQKKLIDAAFQAHVQRLIPADFGSCDSADEATNELLPLMRGKQHVRHHLQSLQDADRGAGRGTLTWTSLITGHFFDWGLANNLLLFDVPGRRARLLDGGNVRFSASTLDFIARATVEILKRPGETANRILYVHSHHVTQREILAVLEKVSAGQAFEQQEVASNALLEAARPLMLQGDSHALEEVVAVWGIVASDWKAKQGFANALLGLQEEDLEETIRKVVLRMQR